MKRQVSLPGLDILTSTVVVSLLVASTKKVTLGFVLMERKTEPTVGHISTWLVIFLMVTTSIISTVIGLILGGLTSG
jgi:hypothetical protein